MIQCDHVMAVTASHLKKGEGLTFDPYVATEGLLFLLLIGSSISLLKETHPNPAAIAAGLVPDGKAVTIGHNVSILPVPPPELTLVRERALAAASNTNIHDEVILRAYLDPANEHSDETVPQFTSNTNRIEVLTQYHLNIETNRNIARMIEALKPTKDSINRLLTKTMRPQDFLNGRIAQMTDFTLETGIFAPRPDWGGGLSGDNNSGVPIIIFGPYNDRVRLQNQFDLALRNLVQVSTHERFHTDIQSQSKSRDRVVVDSRELYGRHYDNFQDPRSQMSHEAMGLWEYIGGKAIGVDAPEWISWRNYFIFDRSVRAGVIPEQAILNLVQVSVHGTSSNFEDNYNRSRLPGDPTFQDLFDKNAAPTQWITPGTETKFLQTLSRLAGLPPPPEFILAPPIAMIPTFTGPEPSGLVAPHIKIEGVKNYAITAAIDFTDNPWAKSATARNATEILSDINNPKYDYGTMAWLLRADPYWIQKFYGQWGKTGAKSKLNYEEFKSILKVASPKAAARWQQIEAGPKLDLPKPTGRILRLTIPPSEWGTIKEATCLANATWFMPILTGRGQMIRGADGSYRGEIEVGRVYLDADGNLIQKCPEGAIPYAWLNGIKTTVGIWQ